MYINNIILGIFYHMILTSDSPKTSIMIIIVMVERAIITFKQNMDILAKLASEKSFSNTWTHGIDANLMKEKKRNQLIATCISSLFQQLPIEQEEYYNCQKLFTVHINWNCKYL